MATLTEQMESLTADILSGHEERRSSLGTLREEAAELREQGQALREQTQAWIEENRAWLRDFLEQCRSGLEEVRTDLEGARRAWQEMLEARVGAREGKPTPGGGPEARTRRRPRRARSK